jgi:hypothetical protein
MQDSNLGQDRSKSLKSVLRISCIPICRSGWVVGCMSQFRSSVYDAKSRHITRLQNSSAATLHVKNRRELQQNRIGKCTGLQLFYLVIPLLRELATGVKDTVPSEEQHR